MSGTNDIDMNTLEPASSGAPAKTGGGGSNSGEPSKSKALRTDVRGGEAEPAVFRLDALSPGAGQDGAGQLPTPGKSKISHAAIFFLVLIVVGGVLLMVMRRIGINPMSAIAKMQEPEIDLTKNAKGSVDHNKVLRDLSESAVKGQVPIGQVQKNPFEILEVSSVKEEDPDKKARLEEERRRKEAAARKQRLEATLGTLKIHSIINGSTPVARINDTAVRVGDVIDEIFTVKAISGRSVELECDGQSWTLSLDEDKGAVKKGAKRK